MTPNASADTLRAARLGLGSAGVWGSVKPSSLVHTGGGLSKASSAGTSLSSGLSPESECGQPRGTRHRYEQSVGEAAGVEAEGSGRRPERVDASQ